MRLISGFVLALTLSLPLAATAADPPAGTWRLSLPVGRGQELVLLFAFAEKDGKWTGEILDSSLKAEAQPKLTDLAVKDGHVKFGVSIAGRGVLSFDGVLTKDKKKIAGSIAAGGGDLVLADLHPSGLKKLDDPFELARDTLAHAEEGAALFDPAFEVLSQAAAKKLPADEVRRVVERVNRASAAFGPRWERATALRLTTTLLGQEGLADVALAQARRAERMLTDDDEIATRLEVLQTLTRALTAAGKADEAKPLRAQIAKLETRDYLDYAKTHPPFKPDPFTGRKGKSDRAVLVELFTGAECPPCAAADLAFDGLLKTYKPTDVVLLQYHFHVPAPDPLTSPDGMDRARYYQDQIEGAPTAFVGGKMGPEGGGPASASEKKYKAFREQIDAALEKPGGVKVALSAAKADKGYTAKAAVTDLEAPGEKVVLRFALAEDRVRFAGGNGIRYHHMVVRAMPGGAKGFPLTKKAQEQTVTFNPDEVRESLTKYLDGLVRKGAEFPNPDRPLALTNLKLVAFVQNDETKDVLHAVQIDLEK
jgi:hypothetical protein